MTGSNHMVAGALIASVTPQPVVAIPLALVSHFVMDALPHYGDNNKNSWLNQVLIIDALLTVTFIFAIIIGQPIGWVLMLSAGLVALSPDLVWLPHYIADMKGNPLTPGPFARFSKWIQWGERPWGIYIEGAVLIVLLGLFLQTIR